MGIWARNRAERFLAPEKETFLPLPGPTKISFSAYSAGKGAGGWVTILYDVKSWASWSTKMSKSGESSN